jgi:hypothetical protein
MTAFCEQDLTHARFERVTLLAVRAERGLPALEKEN